MTLKELRQRLESLLRLIQDRKWEHASNEAEALNEEVGSASDKPDSASLGVLYESLLNGPGSACCAIADKDPDMAEQCVSAVIIKFSESDKWPSNSNDFPEIE